MEFFQGGENIEMILSFLYDPSLYEPLGLWFNVFPELNDSKKKGDSKIFKVTAPAPYKP